MKKFDISKFWVAIAVVVVGGVCMFLPNDVTRISASAVNAVEEVVEDSIEVDTIEVK